jgi:iron(III) transport system permease protein
MRRARARAMTGWCSALGLAAFLLLPWYALEDGLLSSPGWAWWPLDPEVAPALVQGLALGRPWLLLLGALLLVPLIGLRLDPLGRARLLVGTGLAGLVLGAAQGLLIGPLGWGFEALDAALGPLPARQHGMGAGALGVHLVFLLHLTEGLALRGVLRGDAFLTAVLGVLLAAVGLFVGCPLALVLVRALELEAGGYSPSLLLHNLSSPELWALSPLEGRLGLAWGSLALAVSSGALSTALGLAFALVAVRSRFFARRTLRALTVLPIVTPPFVLGLALILLFGRAGAVTTWLEARFGLDVDRALFGFRGILLAQVLAFTPVAFMVLCGVLEGIGPSLEEAAATLRADRWRVFRTVTFPLLRPGLANAFLLGFIESLADFGNPMVLGGSYEVLSTRIYYAVAGAESDVPRAAALSLVLLAFTWAAFALAERSVGRGHHVTVTGKGDGGSPAPLPRRVSLVAHAAALPWAAFTALLYAVILGGGFVTTFGRDHRPTLEHFAAMFGASLGAGGLELSGAAWDSLLSTVLVAAAAAPLTALVGIATAYLLARERFFGHRLFEVATLASFAVPGTVVGISYVLAFNAPPIELTGSAAILVTCFVFRNMPVGVRAGLATLAQLDPTLDEASRTLGAGSAHTLRRVVAPLLAPAISVALVHGFVRAMTAISAVIFLVSADHNLATTYILGRVENGEYGPAIAYSGVLIVLMLAVIVGIERAVGRRELGRRA